MEYTIILDIAFSFSFSLFLQYTMSSGVKNITKNKILLPCMQQHEWEEKPYSQESWQELALTLIMVCIQSGFLTLTFLGFLKKEINGPVSIQVTNASPIILSWPFNLVCLFFFFCFSLSMWLNLWLLLESRLSPSLPFTPYLFHKEIYNLRIIRWVGDMR